MSDEQERQDKRQEAMEWVGKAYQLHMKGEVAKAIGLYTKSIEICPTAEAYTFRGWARSFEKDYASAIEDCHRAIDLDPEFGNPYNDIGAYYVEQGELDKALEHFRKSLDENPRYALAAKAVERIKDKLAPRDPEKIG